MAQTAHIGIGPAPKRSSEARESRSSAAVQYAPTPINDGTTAALIERCKKVIGDDRSRNAFETVNGILFEYVQSGGDESIWDYLPAAGASQAADRVRRVWAVQEKLGFIDHEKLA